MKMEDGDAYDGGMLFNTDPVGSTEPLAAEIRQTCQKGLRFFVGFCSGFFGPFCFYKKLKNVSCEYDRLNG